MPFSEHYHAEAADPDCIEPQVATAMLSRLPWRRLVVLGDSVAAGIMAPVDGYRNECFADRLGSVLAATRDPFLYRNLAVRDLRIAEIHQQQAPAALALRPDVAMVVAGGNDALGRNFDPDGVRGELEALIRPLHDAGAIVITIGLFDLARSGLMPPAVRAVMTERFDALDEVTSAVSAAFGGIHVDTHSHPRSADREIYSPDKIHANARGHGIAFKAIVEALAHWHNGSGEGSRHTV